RPLANLFSADAAPLAIRLRIVADLAAAFFALESLDLIHGDLSENNATWRVTPLPSLLLLGCDGLPYPADPPRAAATAHWAAPRLTAQLITAHDQASDRWALALAIWRTIVGSLSATAPDTRAEAFKGWPSDLATLLHDTFDDPLASARPGPERWLRALKAL